MAALSPGWASETASWTPMRARVPPGPETLAPEGLGLGLADIEADHLAAPRLVHAACDHDALANDPAPSRTRSTLASRKR